MQEDQSILIRNMELNDSGYVVHWAIAMFCGKPIVNLNYDLKFNIEKEPPWVRERYVYLTKTEDGYVVEGWMPEETTIHATIAIYTRKYVWTGATDDDVAPVSLK